MASSNEEMATATTTLPADTTNQAKDETLSNRTDAEASASTDEDVNLSRRPTDVALMQQRMKAWQPLLSPRWVIAAYLVIAIIFIPVGESRQECVSNSFLGSAF